MYIFDKPKSKVQVPKKVPGLGVSLKSYGPGATHRLHGSDCTTECQEGVPSQGGQQREVHRRVHHAQVEYYEGLFKQVSDSDWSNW